MATLAGLGLTTGAPASVGVDTRSSHYQELKSRIHQDLLNRLDLERLTRVRREEAEPEIRNLIVGMVEHESAAMPLSRFEREALISDVVNELFGLGPLEVLLQRSDDLRHPGQPLQADLHRTQRQARRNRRRVQGRRAPDADHRAHRQLGRPAHRRIEPDGGRPSRRRLARQRDHSAAGARRPGDVDSPFQTDRLGANDLVDARVVDRADAATFCRRGRVPAEPDRLRRHRLRQDDAAEHSVELHRGNERIVTIEDAAELMLQQQHVVRLETRPPNIEGKGAVRAARAGDQRPAYAARSHHHRRGPRRRSARHAAGHEHRPRRQLTTVHANSRATRCPAWKRWSRWRT